MRDAGSHDANALDAFVMEEADSGLLDAGGPRGSDAGSEPEGGPVLSDASLELGASFAERDPAYLFEQDTLRTFELRLRDEDLAKLDADPAAEEYVPGELLFEGGLVANVGIRYKGSTGAFAFCVSDSIFPPSGSKTCAKLGMKIKINYVDDDARFFKQKKIQFHAMNMDQSLLRERFGYGLFNAMGIYAPRTVHVRMVINGRFIGIFLLVEVIDGPFVRERFADGGRGNLYKEVWPIGNDEARYLAALETNRDENPSAAKIVGFANALGAANDETLPDVVEHWIDPDYAARFIALDRALRHDDGPHHWYCGGGAALGEGSWHSQRGYANTKCGNHNYFWYEDTGAERLWPIPWDLDNAMLGTANGFTAVLSDWDDLTVDCSKLQYPLIGPPQMPATCDPLHRGFALTLRERVKNTLLELAAGPLTEAAIDATWAPWIAQLEPVVAEANAAGLSEPTVSNWKKHIQTLRSSLVRIRDEALSHALE